MFRKGNTHTTTTKRVIPTDRLRVHNDCKAISYGMCPMNKDTVLIIVLINMYMSVPSDSVISNLVYREFSEKKKI